jgi:hypothetical protein
MAKTKTTPAKTAKIKRATKAARKAPAAKTAEPSSSASLTTWSRQEIDAARELSAVRASPASSKPRSKKSAAIRQAVLSFYRA